MPAFNDIKAREYKVMLRAPRFWGGRVQRAAAVNACWKRLGSLVKAVGLDEDGGPGVQNPPRSIRFYDTASHDLYRRFGYLLRQRRDIGSGGEWTMTLKYRDSDWLRAASQKFDAAAESDFKFEEDIKAHVAGRGFQLFPLFSRSADAAVDQVPVSMGEAVLHFTDLDAANLPPATASLTLVRDFEAEEQVYEGMKFELAEGVKAKCAIILWSRAGGDPSETVAAEFSTRYKLENGSRSPDIAAKIWRAFTAICGDDVWADPRGPTKTAFVYEKS